MQINLPIDTLVKLLGRLLSVESLRNTTEVELYDEDLDTAEIKRTHFLRTEIASWCDLYLEIKGMPPTTEEIKEHELVLAYAQSEAIRLEDSMVHIAHTIMGDPANDFAVDERAFKLVYLTITEYLSGGLNLIQEAFEHECEDEEDDEQS